MTLKEKAYVLASFAHNGQKDKTGEKYIYHPLAVASRLRTEEEQVVALLHDVAEDTVVTLDDLREEFGDRIADALTALTHREDEDYFSYIDRVSKNPLAARVKLADLNHNMEATRLDTITPWYLEHFQKYAKACEILLRSLCEDETATEKKSFRKR